MKKNISYVDVRLMHIQRRHLSTDMFETTFFFSLGVAEMQ